MRKAVPKKKRRPAPLRVAIVGGGMVGSVLGRILTEGGGRVTAVVSRSRSSARAAAVFVRCRNFSTALTAIPPETDIVLIATPHDAVRDVARTLASLEELNFTRMAVCHASGMLTAEVLEPLAVRGAAVFSFHPLQTFPRDFRPAEILPTARGIVFGADGSPRALRRARQFAAALGGRVIMIRPEMRRFYHAACVAACNHLTALLANVESMYRILQPERNDFFPVFRPIIEATLQNIGLHGPAEALTGPVARGGVATVAQHLAAVERYAPHLIPYFTRMSLETVRLAVAKGSLVPERREALERLIRSYTEEAHPAEGNP